MINIKKLHLDKELITIKRRIIYEIYTPAFCTDFKDLTNKLNYIEELRKYKKVLINATPKSSNSDLEILDSKKVS